MRRLLLLALAVLVPFAALIAFGFSLLKDPPPISLPIAELPLPVVPPPTAAPPVAPPPPARPPLPVDVVVVAPPNPDEPPGHPPPLDPARAQRVAMLAAIEPLVHQCFKDLSERVREPLRVTVTFNTTADGRFEGAMIKRASWPDPHLAACITDSFEDASFEGTGTALRRQVHTFAYDRPDAGR